MNGRIGVAFRNGRVHILNKYEPTGYGISICGWSGFTVITDDAATCQECLKRKDAYEEQKAKERAILEKQVRKGNSRCKNHKPKVERNRFF